MIVENISPFTPGSPVPYELFVGRKQHMNELVQYLNETVKGKQSNIFLSGERGIGKSSLAAYVREIATSKLNMIGIHVMLGGVVNSEEMIRRMLEEILRVNRDQPWYEKIKKLFGETIKEVDLFGIAIRFDPPSESLKQIGRELPSALMNIINNTDKRKQGLFIALDDINGLTENREFADWYKSFVDYIATHYQNYPLMMMLIGLPERRDQLALLQPSIMRIFRVLEIPKLSDEEVVSFYIKAFNSKGITIEEEALNLMKKYASGLPILMQEIGDAVFRLNIDDVISYRDAFEGIIRAAAVVGNKYLDPKIYNTLRSESYHSILNKIGKRQITICFYKKDIENMLSDKEKKVFNNFLNKLRSLEIIENDLERGRGAYKFVNEIYPLYIRMKSLQKQKAE